VSHLCVVKVKSSGRDDMDRYRIGLRPATEKMKYYSVCSSLAIFAPPLCAYLCYAVVSKQNFNWFTLLNTNFDEKFKLFDRTIKSLKKRLRFKGQSHEKVCEVMIWDVSFGLKSLPTVCKILNRMIKSYDFSNRVALDVRPVSLICRFCGAPQDRTADCHNTLQKNRLFRRTVPFNKKQNPVKKQRLRMSKHCIFQLTVFWYI
jgi:hypothetical protein